MQLLRRDLAEAKADEDAERDDPGAQRYHAARAFILQKQINVQTVQAVSHRPKQSPMIVNADPSRRPRPEAAKNSVRFLPL